MNAAASGRLEFGRLFAGRHHQTSKLPTGDMTNGGHDLSMGVIIVRVVVFGDDFV
jgi:hypothetical protein